MQQDRIAILSGEAILDYIPQRPPVVVVDTFYGIADGNSYSGYTVPAEGGVFCRDGALDECALIEHIAQSAALRVGWLCVSAGNPVPLGFIGSVSRCDIGRKVSVGERLYTTIGVEAQVGAVTLARAETTVGDGERVCACTLKIFLQP